MSEVIIETPLRRWIENPAESNGLTVVLYSLVDRVRVRVPVSRSLVGEPSFDLGAYLDRQGSMAVEAATATD